MYEEYLKTRLMREALLKEAYEWVGTPFHEQASVKQVGCDCLGFVKGAAENVGVKITPYHNYKPLQSDFSLTEYLDKYYKTTDRIRPGLLLVFLINKYPSHLAIAIDENYMLHSNSKLKKVLKERITDKYKKRLYKIYEVC